MTRFVIILLSIVLIGCHRSQKEDVCESYDCRRKNLSVKLLPSEIKIGESATLEIKREKYYLPKMRVFLGDYDDDFQLPEGTPLQYFEGSDSIATTVLVPESRGKKRIRGIIEEYETIGIDSVNSYHYPFEVELIVRDTLTTIKS